MKNRTTANTNPFICHLNAADNAAIGAACQK